MAFINFQSLLGHRKPVVEGVQAAIGTTADVPLTNEKTTSKLKKGIFYGWWVLLACALIQFYLSGTFSQGFTALFNPLVTEFGWTYAAISLAFTFRGFESGFLAPFVGFFVDKFGARRLLLVGIIVMGLGFVLFSRIQSLWSFYAFSMVLAFGMTLASGVVTMTAVTKWFMNHKRRTLAMGLLTSGFGIGGLLVPGVVWLVDASGWREAVVIFGIGAVVLGVPLALLTREPKKGELGQVRRTAAQTSREFGTNAGVKSVIKRKEFWLISLAVLFAGIAGQAAQVHEIPYLVSVGVTRTTAGIMVVVLSLSNAAGRLLFGWMGDIMDKRLCFAIGSFIKAGGVLAFALATSVGQFVPAIIALGVGMGGVVPLRPALQVEFFGMNSFATIQGLLMACITVGSIISPLFAGWMFDVMGGYRVAFLILAGVTFIAVPVVLAAKRPAAAAT